MLIGWCWAQCWTCWWLPGSLAKQHFWKGNFFPACQKQCGADGCCCFSCLFQWRVGVDSPATIRCLGSKAFTAANKPGPKPAPSTNQGTWGEKKGTKGPFHNQFMILVSCAYDLNQALHIIHLLIHIIFSSQLYILVDFNYQSQLNSWHVLVFCTTCSTCT